MQLAAWMRVRYPSIIDGAIAASAPVGAFVSRFSEPPFDPAAYWKARPLDLSSRPASKFVARIDRHLSVCMRCGTHMLY